MALYSLLIQTLEPKSAMMAPLRSKNGRDLLADTENLRNVLMSYKI